MEPETVVNNFIDMDEISRELEIERFFNSQSEPLQNLDPFFNVTSIDDVVKLIDRNFAWFLFSLVCSISWIVYITFYSSRVTGLLLTKIVNRFVKTGHLRIGNLKNLL